MYCLHKQLDISSFSRKGHLKLLCKKVKSFIYKTKKMEQENVCQNCIKLQKEIESLKFQLMLPVAYQNHAIIYIQEEETVKKVKKSNKTVNKPLEESNLIQEETKEESKQVIQDNTIISEDSVLIDQNQEITESNNKVKKESKKPKEPKVLKKPKEPKKSKEIQQNIPSEEINDSEQQLNNKQEKVICEGCDREFDSKRGLGSHKKFCKGK